MAKLTILEPRGEPKGNIHLCQWCQAFIKGNIVYLGQGPSGTRYLVCPVCKEKATESEGDLTSGELYGQFRTDDPDAIFCQARESGSQERQGRCVECGRKATYFVVVNNKGKAELVDLCGYHRFPGGMRKSK